MKNRPLCIIEGCTNLALPRGNGKYRKLCTRHHKEKYGIPYSPYDRIKKQFPNKKCILCGWEKAECDKHRILPKNKGGTYKNGNVIIVCPNCHRLIHRGLILIKPSLPKEVKK